MTGVPQPGFERKIAPNQQLIGVPCWLLPQAAAGIACRVLKTLAAVALKFRLGSSAEAGAIPEGSAAAGGAAEKMLPLPARTLVGWVASPAMEAGCSGAGGKASAGGGALAAGACASRGSEAFEMTGST